MNKIQISIVEVNDNLRKGETPRVSTLEYDPNLGEFQVLGNLPHSYRFKAATKSDAEKLNDCARMQWAYMTFKED